MRKENLLLYMIALVGVLWGSSAALDAGWNRWFVKILSAALVIVVIMLAKKYTFPSDKL
jgi:hypothetical protein